MEQSKTNCGVYVGIGMMDYPILLGSDKNMMNSYTHTGTAHSVAANRISYAFDFQGPSVAIDTACASSMTAAHFACSGLRNDECQIALVAGSNLNLLPEVTIGFSKLGVLSSNGTSCPFDEKANGYVRSEGWGAVILKRLDHAIVDGDHIYSIIKGSAIADNGASASLTMPSAEAQERIIQETYFKFGVPLASVQYVEAHGTSTPVGDPLEAKAIGRVFGKSRSGLFPIKIGSVKSNFGHMECAAGIASIIKCSLMLEQRLLCPSINFHQLNPNIDAVESNLTVQTCVEPFGGNPNTKVAIGINSFGFGGALAHMIMEEAPLSPNNGKRVAGWNMTQDRTTGLRIMIPLTAKTLSCLQETVRNWMDYEEKIDAMSVVGWQSTRRDHHNHRLVVIAHSKQDFNKKCLAFLDDIAMDTVVCGEKKSNEAFDSKKKVCFIFPGTGQQNAEMGRALYQSEPVFRRTVDLCDEYFRKTAGFSFLEKTGVFKTNIKVSIDDIEVAQPAITFCQLALVELLRDWGVKADVVVGHSLGEVAAAYTAGSITLEEAISLIYHRCHEQAKLKGIGTMAAVRGSESFIEEICNETPGIHIACYNAPETMTIAGPNAAIDSVIAKFPKQAKKLRVECPFHTKCMDPIKQTFQRAIRPRLRQTRPKGSAAFFSTVTGDRYHKTLGTDYWWDNIRKPVRFAQALSKISVSQEISCYIEIGASPTLLACIPKILQGSKKIPLAVSLGSRTMDDRTTFLQAIAKLYVVGYPLKWGNVSQRASSFAQIPTYAWEHTSHWTEPREREQLRLGHRQKNAFKDNDARMSLDSSPFLSDHVVEGRVVFPAAGYIELAIQYGLVESAIPCLFDLKFSALTVFSSSSNEMQLTPSKDNSKISLFNQNGIAASMIVDSRGPAEASFLPVSAIRRRCHKASLNSSSFYESLRKFGFHYGQEFRVVEHVFSGDEEALAIIKPSNDTHQKSNIVVVDGMFQTSFQAAMGLLENQTYLPVSIDQMKFTCERIADDCQFIAWSKVVDSNPGMVQFDVKLCRATDGLIILHVKGLRLQALGTTQSVEHYSDCLYKTVWQPADAALPVISELGNTFGISQLEQRYPRESSLIKKAESILPVLSDINLAIISDALERLKPNTSSKYISRLRSIISTYGKGQVSYEEAMNRLLELQRSFKCFELELKLLFWLGSELPNSLQNSKKEAIGILFSERGLNRYFIDSLSTRIYYKILRDAVKVGVEKCLQNKKVVRVLEIGGRMGGLAAYILQPLRDYLENGDVHYTFTDLHATFFPHAQTLLGQYPMIQYKTLDIEKNVQTQDFLPENYDIVVCMDTLHSVVDVSDSLYNITDLLTHDGWLLLMEATKTSFITEVVFGSLDLCWVFDDDYRQESCWMSKEGWVSVLEENNDLDGITCISTKNEFFHTIFAAQKKVVPLSDDKLCLISSETDSSLLQHIATEYLGDVNTLNHKDFVKFTAENQNTFVKAVLVCDESTTCMEQLHHVLKAAVSLQKQELLIGLWVISLQNKTAPPHTSSLIEGYMRSVINEFSSIPLFVCRINKLGFNSQQAKEIFKAIQNNSQPETRIGSDERLLVPKLVPLNLLPEEERVISDTWVLNYDGENIDFVSLLEEELEVNEVYIKVKSAGVNFKDVMTCKGLLADLGIELGSSQFGIECAGVIEAVGRQVTDFSVGDEVIAFGDFCFTTHLTTEATLCVHKPDSMPWETAATLGIAYITAYHALIERGGLSEGETVLIHSACGGVGLAAVNIAKMVGANIIATAGTKEKRAYLRNHCGLDMISDSRSLQWVEDVMTWTQERGVDLILNSLAGKYIPAGIQCLATGGRICEIGKRDLLQNSKLEMKPFLENKSFLSVQMDFLMKERPQKVQKILKKVVQLYEDKEIFPLPTQSHSIFDYQEILSSMASGSQIGKIVFNVPDQPTMTCIRSKPVLFQPRFSYLVTGGLGGIGQQFLKWMVNEGNGDEYVVGW